MFPRNYFAFLQRHAHWALPLTRIILLVYLCVGLLLVFGYGISWDEPLERYTGLVNLKYILETFGLTSAYPAGEWNSVPELSAFHDRFYGSWFQVIAILLEQLFGLKDTYSIVLLHHILTFLLYCTGIYFLSKTIQQLFQTPWITLLCTVLFITQPRFFAEAFYNSKDIVLLSVIFIALYFIVKMLLSSNRSWYWILAALFTGLAIATRVIALALFAEVIVLLLLDIIFRPKDHLVQRLLTLPLYFIGTILFTILFWPYLWSDPKENFMASWEVMSMFHWNGLLLFNGEGMLSTEIPWNYIPLWMLVTTPLLLLLGMAWGLLAVPFSMVKYTNLRALYLQIRFPILFAGLFLGPVLMVIYLHSVLYDGWRHLYFIMTGGILISAYGLYVLNQQVAHQTLIRVVMTLGALQILWNIYSIASLHPYQNVYFNALAGDQHRRNFEMDYWGLSYRKGFEYILDHDPRDTIRVCYVGHWDACDFHRSSPGKKLISVGFEKADYFLSTYRFHPEQYTDLQEVYTTIRGKDTIMSVFLLRKP